MAAEAAKAAAEKEAQDRIDAKNAQKDANIRRLQEIKAAKAAAKEAADAVAQQAAQQEQHRAAAVRRANLKSEAGLLTALGMQGGTQRSPFSASSAPFVPSATKHAGAAAAAAAAAAEGGGGGHRERSYREFVARNQVTQMPGGGSTLQQVPSFAPIGTLTDKYNTAVRDTAN